MSFKDELEKIVNELLGHNDGVEFGNGYHDDCKEEAEQALTSIINPVDKELPERKTMTNVPLILPSADDNWGRAQASREGFMYGYNQAIYDMRAKLKGDK